MVREERNGQRMDRQRDTSEIALRIKGEEVKMSTKRVGERDREKKGERAGRRQTDSKALKFMAFFIFRAENQYCLLWMR